MHIVGYPEPFYFHFTAKGKLDKYEVENDFLFKEEAMAMIGDKINNYVGGKTKKTSSKENNSEE